MYEVKLIDTDIKNENLNFRTEIEALKYRMLLLTKGVKATHRYVG